VTDRLAPQEASALEEAAKAACRGPAAGRAVAVAQVAAPDFDGRLVAAVHTL